MDTRWVRRTLAALGLAALAACGGTRPEGLVRAPGTSTSTAATALPSTTAATTARSSTTTKRTTTTTLPGPVLIRYRVEAHTTDPATADFGAVVDATLHDPRSWQRAGFVFQRA